MGLEITTGDVIKVGDDLFVTSMIFRSDDEQIPQDDPKIAGKCVNMASQHLFVTLKELGFNEVDTENATVDVRPHADLMGITVQFGCRASRSVAHVQ